MQTFCTLCPRNCHADRKHGNSGVCGMPSEAILVRAARHDGEEPCISGTRGSGTIFFAGCPLGCVYCQNDAISRPAALQSALTRTVDAKQLRAIALQLAETGVHNINFVTPTHYSHLLAEAIGDGFGIPTVYNCGGYEKTETLRNLQGKIDIYMPDLKYLLPEPAARYSHAPDYPARATEAICEMVRQTGPFVMDEDGILRRGVLIRHLVLPGQSENTRRVIDWVADTFPSGTVLFSLMGQYTPRPGIGERYPELAAPLSPDAYAAAADYLEEAGIEDGYLQEPDASGEEYIPAWGEFPAAH